MAYQVFIERARDSSPSGVKRLAEAIASRYGLPAATLSQRMAAGRFRVKKGVDLDTAKRFAADLGGLGAVCTVVDDAGQAAPLSPAPEATPAPILKQSAAQSARAESSDDYQSGLAAAFSGATASQDLGALAQFADEKTPSDMFQLASLDGQDDAPPLAMAASYAEPVAAPAAEVTAGSPPGDPPPAVPSPAPAADSGPVDPFAPPDAQSDDHVLQLAAAAAPAPVPQPPPAARQSAALAGPPLDSAVLSEIEDGAMFDAAPGAPPVPAAATRSAARNWFRQHVARSEQARGLVGVVLVLLVGFVPARLFWASRVDNAQVEVEASMAEYYSDAKRDPKAWDDIEVIGRSELNRQRSRLSSSRFSAILVWLAISGALGFVWFRKIPWDDV